MVDQTGNRAQVLRNTIDDGEWHLPRLPGLELLVVELLPLLLGLFDRRPSVLAVELPLLPPFHTGWIDLQRAHELRYDLVQPDLSVVLLRSLFPPVRAELLRFQPKQPVHRLLLALNVLMPLLLWPAVQPFWHRLWLDESLSVHLCALPTHRRV
jgi:hypothetical protein